MAIKNPPTKDIVGNITPDLCSIATHVIKSLDAFRAGNCALLCTGMASPQLNIQF